MTRSIFSLRLWRASCAMRLMARMTLKINRMVAVTKIVATDSTLLRQIFLKLREKLLEMSFSAEVFVFIRPIIAGWGILAIEMD